MNFEILLQQCRRIRFTSPTISLFVTILLIYLTPPRPFIIYLNGARNNSKRNCFLTMEPAHQLRSYLGALPYSPRGILMEISRLFISAGNCINDII